jgi:hypothetical protein
MKSEDLLSALSSELEYQMKRQTTRFPRGKLRKLLLWADRLGRVMEHSDTPDDYASAAVAELFEALEQFALPYGYFGSLEGDGADYGYWLQSNLVEDFDGLKVDDTSEVPRSYRGEVLHVNDHGNVTLYISNGRGKLTEIWGVV